MSWFFRHAPRAMSAEAGVVKTGALTPAYTIDQVRAIFPEDCIVTSLDR